MGIRTEDKPPTVEIVVGQSYEFVSEVEQEHLPLSEALCRFTGQQAIVLRLNTKDNDPCNSPLYDVRFPDGTEAQAWEEELSGWDKGLKQYFLPDGTYAGTGGFMNRKPDHPNGGQS